MTVELFERGRFKVSSQSGEPDYFVDYGAMSGLGLCDCPDYKNRCIRLIRTMKAEGTFKPMDPTWNPEYTICKHIRAVDKHIALISKLKYKEQLREKMDYNDEDEY